MRITLKTDATGLLSVLPIVQYPSPPVLSANFKAGNYVLPTSTITGLALTGPGVIPGSVMTKWQVNKPAQFSFAGCGTPTVFYVGPLADNPYYASRLRPAGITNIEYSYGVVGSDSCNVVGWGSGTLVGFSQSGNLLTIASFTDYASGRDHSVPVATYTYRMQ